MKLPNAFYVLLDDSLHEAAALANDKRWRAEHPDETPEDFLADATPLHLTAEGSWTADADCAQAFDTLEAARASLILKLGAFEATDRVWIEDGDGHEVYVLQEGAKGE